MKCFYCKMNDALDYQVVNPVTKAVHPTCVVCEYAFDLIKKDMRRFQFLRPIGNLALLVSIISLLFYGWKLASVLLFGGITLKLMRLALIGCGTDKRNVLEGQFAKSHNLFSDHTDQTPQRQIRWCKNCFYFRKVGGWDKADDGIWTSCGMINTRQIPCKIASETVEVWTHYFELPREQRTLYPKECPRLEMRT